MADYLISSRVVMIPALFLPIVTFTTFRLEGTAVEFRELGQQQYKNDPSANPEKGKQ
jgi:hypothetical protein